MWIAILNTTWEKFFDKNIIDHIISAIIAVYYFWTKMSIGNKMLAIAAIVLILAAIILYLAKLKKDEIILAIATTVLILAAIILYLRGAELTEDAKILAITAIVLFFTAIILYWTLSTNVKNSKAEFGIQIMRELRTEEWRERLERIYLADDSYIKPGGILKFDCEYTLDKLEWVGTMLNEKIFDNNMVMKLIIGIPLRVWYRLGDEFVKSKRKDRGHYARYAEYFAKESIKYHIKCDPMEEWTKLKNNDKEIHIIDKLIKEKKVINSKELMGPHRFRRFHALIFRNEKLYYGYPIEQEGALEDALECKDLSRTKIILSNNNIQLENLKKISKPCENKWKIIDIKGKHIIIIKSGDKMYNAEGYKEWWNEIKSIRGY